MQIDDFGTFFQAIHGCPPFPWQQRLARQVCECGQWPELIDIPTGAGKTACLDVAVFHLAWAAVNASPHARRRIAFVVDRRIVVDEAARRADRIAAALASATGDASVLGRCARALESLGGEKALGVVTLRGGMPREASAIRDPATPHVILSTVDQIGSRLLFRGYGVSDRMRPLHAGLFGFDTLVLLDEAHIAEPMQQTLAGVVREQARAMRHEIGRPMRWCRLSATPGRTADFSIDQSDRDDPVLGARLRASKWVDLVEVVDRSALVSELVRRATLLTAAVGDVGQDRPLEATRIGIVVNRVASAREVFERLRKQLQGKAETYLLTGRVRPLERDKLLWDLKPKVLANANPRPGTLPIVVVATQTIEVGADFDFQTMLIEAASYPAIRQRLGRLNRLAHQSKASAVILLPLKGCEDDPIYDTTLAASWKFLKATAGSGARIDLGLLTAPPAIPSVIPQEQATPLLTPALVNLFSQTQPRPLLEPEVASFLHGFDGREPDCALVWRSGLCTKQGQIDESLAQSVLATLPPNSLESMPIPRSALVLWLRNLDATKGKLTDSSDDLEGDRPDAVAEIDSASRTVLVQDRGEQWKLKYPAQIRGGLVVVVPAEWGGLDDFGFSPDSTDTVKDLAEDAREGLNQSAATVITAARLRGWGLVDNSEPAIELSLVLKEMAEEALSPKAAARRVLEQLAAAVAGNPALRVPGSILKLDERIRAEECLVQEKTVGLAVTALRPRAADFGDEDQALQRTVDVELNAHGRGVAEYAHRYASALGLGDRLIGDLRLAARLHDIGKADPRFQASLGNHDSSRQLAKGENAVVPTAPRGARHEAYSVAMLVAHSHLLTSADDPELVVHLVGSHHGYGRAWQPDSLDFGATFRTDIDGTEISYSGTPDLGRVDSGWASQFMRLQRRYGPWGLAYLESIIRLADHRRSESEMLGGERRPA